ncbi:MAG: 30S ribosomal protein S6e [Candidatus Bathyarchaeota archaeon]|nr:30S ribosomal protein S6e [Candidatus Bathyarchaeota archaeon]
MAKFKIIVSDPETGKSSVVEVEGSRAVPLVGRRIGETLDGSVVGLSGHKVLITGGCDLAGFPMRPDVHGGVKSRVLLSGGVGYRSKEKGIRRRKTIRGNMVTEDIVQINMKVVEKPEKKPKEEKRAGKPHRKAKKTKSEKVSESS